MNIRTSGLVALTLVMAIAVAAQAGDPVRTIFLERGTGSGSTPMNVGYHPGFDQYYASNGGNPGYGAWVYDAAGNRIQDAVANIDVRAWNYNPDTDLMEVCSFNAVGGGQDRGLIDAVLDNDGLITGNTNTLLTSVPGVNGSQTMPAYDPVGDVFYSRDRGDGVNVARRSDGGLVRTFTLAGAPTLTDYMCGFEPSAGAVIVTAPGSNEALAYDTDGNLLDQWTLDVTVPTRFAVGYANGQLFVFDSSRNGWQGYDLGLAGSKCKYTLKKSRSKKGCGACPEVGSEYGTEAACEKKNDCDKKVKTTIACPDGGSGTCKLKGKRSACG